MKLLLPLVLVLSGCALTPQQAAQQSTLRLCQILAAPLASDERKQSALNELVRREENCNQYLGIMQQQQMNEAAVLNYLQNNQGPKPYMQAPAPPVQTQCRKYGNTLSCQTW